jgi:thioredoxin 1
MNILLRFCIPLLMFFSACTAAEEQYELLEATAFQQKISDSPDAVVVDVRTAEEFAEGHIAGAVSIDWNAGEFDAEAAELDRSKPVFVYCLAGGRSAAAVERMKELGFKNITELRGGMLQWRANQLPETAAKPSGNGGMTPAAFKKLVTDERPVLVDFYAEWCGPCKKMKPFLDEIAEENAAAVKIVRIDVDKHSELARAMEIEMLPTLLLIKDNAVIWRKTGFATKKELLGQLKK